jgi:tetratricopeptide (TPR) repeat protein
MRSFPRLAAPIIALSLAALACAAGAAGGDALPTVSFSTATPGGRISISLLTPTATWSGPGLEATLIGPVATQTAAAATAVAQTATAAVPTPTIPGVHSEPAICPPPGSPTLPSQPPAFSRYAEIVVQYLSEGGPPTILEATLRGWRAVTEAGGLVRADRDFTADGVPEVMVLVFDPDHAEEEPRPGALYIFGCEAGAYRLLYQSEYAIDRGIPTIHSADDINGDFVNDLVYSVETCGEKTCYREVTIIGWNLTLGNFDSLVNAEIVEPSADIVVSDVDEDGLKEVSVTRGIITAPDAGPQRTVTTIWKWDGAFYVVAEVIRSPVEYRIHLIHDGDAALLAGDYDAAIEAFQQAAQDDLLLSWKYPNEARYLQAYAQYRIMLAQVQKGDVGDAQETHDQLLQAFIPPTPMPPPEGEEPPPEATVSPDFDELVPGIEFAQMAEFFWREFSVNRDVVRACEIVVGYARANPAAFEVLNSFGFANPQYTAADMCPFVAEAP